MIWLTWRQFRTQALLGAAVFAAAAVYLVILGSNIRGTYDSKVAGCIAGGCASAVVAVFQAKYEAVLLITSVIVMAVPGVLGVFWGAPLISSELAAGTHRLAWQQSVTRTRWLTVKLLVVGLSSVAFTGLLGLLLSWGAGPYDRVRADRFAAAVFGAHDLVPFAHAAFAFALGVVAGLLLRRPVAAMGLTIVLFAAVQVLVPTTLRPHYLTPHTSTVHLDATALHRADGIQLDGPRLLITGISVPDAWVVSTSQALDGAGRPPGEAALKECIMPDFDASLDCFAGRDLHVTATYHPNARYWPFQWIETALYLAATALLTGCCFWLIRRRVS